MKDKYGKGALIAAGAVACAAAIGIGAATWHISGQHSYDFSGNVQFEGVEGNTVAVSIPDDERGQSISYSSPPEAVNAGGWLYSDGADKENLKITYNVTFSEVTSTSALALTVTAADGKGGGVAYEPKFDSDFAYTTASYAQAVSAGYIASAEDAEIEVDLGGQSGLVAFNKQNNTFSFSDEAEGSTVQISITFAWGERFGGGNPYDTFKDYTDAADRAEAAETLAYIAACLENVTFKVTFYRI